MCLSLTFQDNQTEDYIPRGHDHKGTQLQQLGWDTDTATSKPLVDTHGTQILPKQVTHCKCSFTEMHGTNGTVVM